MCALRKGAINIARTRRWLNDWSYRKSHVINSAIGSGVNYQKKIVVHYGSGSDSGEDVYLNSKCKTDFGDIRFTDNDGTTELDYWIEEKVDSDYAVIWVKVNDDLSSSNQTIYIYYGNASATTTSNGDDTFIFFDDFGSSIDWVNKWQSTDQSIYTLSNGKLIMGAASPSSKLLNSQNTVGGGVAVEALVRCAHPTSQLYLIGEASPAVYTGKDKEALNWSASPEKMHITWNAVDSTLNYAEDLTNYFRMVHKVPSSGNARGEIWLGSSLKHSYESTPANRTFYVSFLQFINSFGYVDFIYVRKYVSPEPSHGSWGEEEQY